MSRVYDGGPAFPCESTAGLDGGRVPQRYSGISLRAYLAAHAPAVPIDFLRKDVPHIIGHENGRKEVGSRSETTVELTVRWGLAYADAMIKELK